MQQSSSSLSYLMSCFHINSRQLASMLNVHYTLISKWQNNKRKLNEHSEHMEHLVCFFVTLDAPNKYATLLAILRVDYPDVSYDSRDKISFYLSRWLAGTDNDNIISQINPGKVSNHILIDVYFKNRGRRDANNRLLDIALALPPDQKIFMFGNDTLDWFLGHEEYEDDWWKKHQSLIQKDAQITIIHTVDRDPEPLFRMFGRFLPFHLTGKTQAYYYPHYADKNVHYAISIIENTAAMFGITIGNSKEVASTYFFKDKASVHTCHAFFNSLLLDSRSLFDLSITQNNNSFLDFLLYALHQPESRYSYSDTPPIYSMPRSTFLSVLEDNGLDHDAVSLCTQSFDALSEAFERQIANNQSRFLWNLEHTLSQLLSSTECYHKFRGHLLKVHPIRFQEHLQHIGNLLNKYEKMEIAILKEALPGLLSGIDFLVKRDNFLLADAHNWTHSIPVVIKEQTIVNACYHHFDNLWNSIPRTSRNKQLIQQKLIEYQDELSKL